MVILSSLPALQDDKTDEQRPTSMKPTHALHFLRADINHLESDRQMSDHGHKDLYN